MADIPYLSSKTELDDYIEQCDALILYFTAVWCGPCRAIAPVMQQLYSTHTNVEIVKVDLDTQRQIVSQYKITAVPTFVALQKGKEVDRIQGANVEKTYQMVKTLSEKEPQSKRRDTNASTSGATSGASENDSQAVEKYAGKGHKLLNKTVLFGEFEALNALPVKGNTDLKNIVREKPDSSDTGIYSDADSQLLVHVPLTNVCKVSSILIKAKKHENTQLPDKIKVWANRTSIISFEDTESINALHSETDIDGWDDQGWYELKLKFVRFQKVTSLDLLLEGEDEDEHTVIDRILIIGLDGEAKNQGKIEKIDHDH